MDLNITETTEGFTGDFRFLSNFYHSYMLVDVTSHLYPLLPFRGKILSFEVQSPTVEHIYQACKAINLKDFFDILNSTSPGIAKRKGSKIELRPDWDDIKISLMECLVSCKFTNADLADMLEDTGNIKLIEYNDWNDIFWGVSKYTNNGENNLGNILMSVRQLNSFK